MEGTLKKLGQKGLIKIWRQRYFKEDPETGKIFYYKSKNDKIPQGFINISEITGVKVFFVFTFSESGSHLDNNERFTI
jgi:hypothetical protein